MAGFISTMLGMGLSRTFPDTEYRKLLEILSWKKWGEGYRHKKLFEA